MYANTYLIKHFLRIFLFSLR